MGREVEAEDAWSTGRKALEEERRKLARKDYAEATRRAAEEKAARFKAHIEAKKRAAEEEAARHAAPEGASLQHKKKKGRAR